MVHLNSANDTDRGANRQIAVWLLFVSALVCATVVLGGVTRLTESGLSMTDWRPVTGWIPPMTLEDWQAAFDKYRQSPEYREINQGMSLESFKRIFWFEYAHRVLGRVIGLVFFLPFVWFLARRKVPRPLVPRLWLLLALGAAQGFVGWYMVASGLVDRPSVSPYRLALHLALAFLIHAMLVWTAAGLLHQPAYGSRETRIARLRAWTWALLALTSLTVVSGAFVAGLDAGLYYNTFPLMGDHFIPPDYVNNLPWWRNSFENAAAAQFNHRILAILAVAAIAILAYASRTRILTGLSRSLVRLVVVMALLQGGLGIATLLAYVPIWLAALHQAGALTLFTLVLLLTWSLRQSKVS